MSTSELSPEQLVQKQSLPGAHLSTEACLAQAKQLQGKVVVVTGAGGGFGRNYSVLAASHGAKVIASDINLAAVQATVDEIVQAGGQAIATRCDTADWDSQVAMFRLAINTYSVVDVVVANAGVTEIPGWFDEKLGENEEPVKPPMATVDINLLGASYTARLAFYHLKKNPSTGLKSIVLLGSMSSFFGIPMAPMYSMSKHAMIGLFRSLYHSATPAGININIVCPWFCATGILSAPTRIAVAGLPLATVDNVVQGIFKGSSDPSFTGNILGIDAAGVLCIPYDAFIVGEGGYYRAFLNRAAYTISTVRTIKDVIAAFGDARKPSPTKMAVKTVGLGALALSAYSAAVGATDVGISGLVGRGAAAATLLVI
ncbi:hypothetical protein BCR35DRAFT_307723 [Leucosporidium creatinivorum]|uniref:NAD(P)-binding protein n=1 Tax=Leucosporidium creatinivorum TaxID=106004 RepID=A0A1Y2ENK9_9BASI|nr:hypothetical protein BCR35DRAFT_307723 [Leucosporidium creatinivorum]